MIRDNLDGARSTMADLDDRLNKLSQGKFFGRCYSRGLETYKVGEIKRLCKEVASPDFVTVLKESARAHRDFYCDYNKRLTLRWAKPNQSSSEYNIRRICTWLGIPDRRGKDPAIVLPTSTVQVPGSSGNCAQLVRPVS